MESVGDDKRAIDEYYSEIGMGGRNTMVSRFPLLISSLIANHFFFFEQQSIFNICQDSLLATPLIIDLCLLSELLTRVQYRTSPDEEFQNLYSVLGLLSYMLKVRLVLSSLYHFFH